MKRWHWLLLTLACGLALCFTRYAGVALVLAGAACLRTWRDRIIVGMPPLLLMGLGFLLTGAMRPYLKLTAERAGYLWSGAGPLWAEFVRLIPGLPLLGLVVYLLGVDRKHRPTYTIAVAVGGYLLALWLMSGIAGYNAGLDSRLLVPAAALTAVLVCGLLIRTLPRAWPFIAAALVVYAVSTSIPVMQHWAKPGNKFFNAPVWRESRLIAEIKAQSDSIPVYTTAPEAVCYLTGRMVFEIPRNDDSHVKDNPDLAQTGGLAVWFYDWYRAGYAQPVVYAGQVARDSIGRPYAYKDSTGCLLVIGGASSSQ